MNFFIPRHILLLGLGAILLIAGVGIGSYIVRSPNTGLNDEGGNLLSTDKSAEALHHNEVPDGAIVKVVRVIDGDTVEIEGGEHVRYIGMDTPETVDPRKPVQCFGVEASKKNKELVEGKTVRLEKDITDRDRYNRLLRYVWLGDTFINLALVEQGFAHSYSYPPDIKYQDQFIAAEKEARNAKSGLWGACAEGATNAIITTPTASPASISASDTSCIIKGNISASGEKIYHLPGCGSYSKTRIDESHGERWFCSEGEAQSAGWRRALNCP